jgi:hypothetical protein
MISLPSLHTLDRAQTGRIWLAAEATDMRCGFDGGARTSGDWAGSAEWTSVCFPLAAWGIG